MRYCTGRTRQDTSVYHSYMPQLDLVQDTSGCSQTLDTNLRRNLITIDNIPSHLGLSLLKIGAGAVIALIIEPQYHRARNRKQKADYAN